MDGYWNCCFNSASSCDIVIYIAEAQCLFLDLFMFLKFIEIVLPCQANPGSTTHAVYADQMSCFMKDSKLCNKLFQAGVLVQFKHFKYTITKGTITKHSVTLTFPNHIIYTQYFKQGNSVCPFDLLYTGLGGFLCHMHTYCHYSGLFHISAITTLAPTVMDVIFSPTFPLFFALFPC